MPDPCCSPPLAIPHRAYVAVYHVAAGARIVLVRLLTHDTVRAAWRAGASTARRYQRARLGGSRAAHRWWIGGRAPWFLSGAFRAVRVASPAAAFALEGAL